jgi:hypothetical protein
MAAARHFMDSLKGDTTVDVLGLTRAKEGVSDALFPATSTLHKKIRYQIFVPAIILALYEGKERINPENELLRLEYQLQKTLIDSGETFNVFGWTRGEALKYWPSTIYWASLNKLKYWGEEPLGRSEALELIARRRRNEPKTDEGDIESVLGEIKPADELIDLCKNVFPKGRMAKRLTFALERAEARFFEKRFCNLFPDSVTSYILKYGSRKWCERPYIDLQCSKNPKLDVLLREGRSYSCIAMGAYYAYRWALCRSRRKNGLLSRNAENANAQHFERWVANNLWRVKKWQFPKLREALTALGGSASENGEAEFVESFLRYASNAGSPISKLMKLELVMRNREEKIKGRNRSHFNPASNLQAPKNTLGEEEYRDNYFDYRWQQGRSNLADIFTALGR